MVRTSGYSLKKASLLSGLFTLAISVIVLGVFSSSASAAFDDLPDRLPDDRYRLFKPDGSEATHPEESLSTRGCYAPGAQRGSCTAGTYGAGGESHQYITISNGQIDDAVTDADYREANYSYFSVYSKTLTAKPLSVDIVSRAIGGAGCSGYTLKATYSSTNPSVQDKVSSRSITGCGHYTFDSIGANYFSQKEERGQVVAYTANVLIEIVGNNTKQASFHLNTGNGGKLSYSPGWLNTYPTNAGDNHKIVYSFKPPCDIRKGSTFDVFWDDLDYGTRFQPTKPSIRLIRHTTTGDNRREVFNVPYPKSGVDNRTVRMSDEMFDSNGDPYSFSLEFDGIRGGNGISIYQPFDSAQAKIECPKRPVPTAANASCSTVTVTGAAGRFYKVYVNDAGSPNIDPDNGGRSDYSGTLPSSGTRTVNLVPDNKTVSGVLRYHVIVYNGSSDSTGRASEISGQTNGNCYTATCSISVQQNVPDENSPPDGSNAVRAGQQFRVYLTLSNAGINDLPLTLNGYELSDTLHLGDGWGAPDGDNANGFGPARMRHGPPATDPNAVIRPGGALIRTITLTAPDEMNARNITVHPDYWGLRSIGSPCGSGPTVPPGGGDQPIFIFQRYDFTATARTSLDDIESPKTATFTSTLKQDRPVSVTGISFRNFYKVNAAGARTPLPIGPISEVGEYGDRNYTDIYGIPPDTTILGDGYCMEIILDRGHGWRGPNNMYHNEANARASDCGDSGGPPTAVVNRPYVRAYGADVAAGGGFGTSCGRTNAGILAYMRPVGEQNPTADRSGSGAQLAAMAVDKITGFTSASVRTVPPSIPNGLTFAHGSGAVDSNSMDAFLGGYMSGDGWCMPDYYNVTQFVDGPNKTVTASNGDINVNGLADKKQTVVNLGGTGAVTIPGGTNYSRKHTVYVDGNVYIRGNIAYSPNYSSGIASIPSFTLVVKGNIYVDSNVTQLDGLYIAQPNGQANTGRIYTCAAGASPLPNGTAIYDNCGAEEGGNRKQLTVNGAFIAEKVVLNRAGYSLRDSRYKEAANNSKAAEVFKFSPEIYLSPPVFRTTATSTSGDYDYIAIPPPIL